MNLAELVLEVAQEIEEYAPIQSPSTAKDLMNWAKQLRRAVRLTENQQPVQQKSFSNQELVEMCKAEFRGKVNKIDDPVRTRTNAEEGISERFVWMEGGLGDGATVGIPSEMPDGAKTIITDQVYVLDNEGSKLKYSEEETLKIRNRK